MANSLKNSSQINIKLPQFDSIFSSSSCPVSSHYIISTVEKVLSDKNLQNSQINTSSNKWKRISSDEKDKDENHTWGICNWKGDNHTLQGISYLYSAKKSSQFLVCGVFKEGKSISSKKYYKVLCNESYYYGKVNARLQPQGQG